MKPTFNNGSIIIRFTKFGYKYSLTNLGKFDDPTAYRQALTICESIQVDIRLGRFTAQSNDELFRAYHPLAKVSSHHEANSFATDAITLIEQFLEKKEFKDKVLSPCLNLLKAYGKQIKTHDDALKFFAWISNDGKRSNSSNNRYLEALAPVCPMFMNVPRLKASKTVKDEKPFTKDEIRSIIQTFEESYSHYTPFIKFLVSTGCRPSEAIALTWSCVDFEAKTIAIKKSMGIAKNGSKVSKATKTGIDRVIPMEAKLATVLRDLKLKSANAFSCLNVFVTPNYQIIGLDNFRSRIWCDALTQAKVPYRTLYNTRHSFCSHFLKENPDFVQLASITHGTKSGIATLQKHYAHLVSKVSMPDMFE